MKSKVDAKIAKINEDTEFVQTFVDKLKKNAMIRGVAEQDTTAYSLGYLVSVLGGNLSSSLKKEMKMRMSYWKEVEEMVKSRDA